MSLPRIRHINPTNGSSTPNAEVVQVDDTEKEQQGKNTTDLLQGVGDICPIQSDTKVSHFEDGGVERHASDGHTAAAAVIGGTAAIAVAPTVITTLGFTSSGIVGGSIAAAIMSSEAILLGGGVPSWGLTATLQSAGAVGIGIGTATGAFALGAVGTYGITRAFKSKTQWIGKLARPVFLKDGNVVAFYWQKHLRFLRLTKDKKVDGFVSK
eukprot:CAMPEP_0176496906 /NCGR_PEP_ID=MMETSP0200_2-20121128/11438_1 /TAXON_ID=947934 /ORGANISM="Chaetoceros sp., Strain GSL56" /LENGTH=210 /DNA_ID=CAMNT_0017894879 /DNA_START=30 /DNA_END=659 /DNA_ORIENTATION=+